MRITCTWNTERKDETRITFSEGFDEWPWLDRADFLKDVASAMQHKYSSVLNEPVIFRLEE